MKAIIVCVEYGDYLRVTLPYNRHHFDDVVIVTTPSDEETKQIAVENKARVLTTTSFYDHGAYFNKWKGLEEGLDYLGRDGIICILDADILWPKEVRGTYNKGYLYTPRRRVLTTFNGKLPQKWRGVSLRMEREWAGYTQIFHADDPHLPKPPWFQQDWPHAAGADSSFQNLWPKSFKKRPVWEVLHLGPVSTNWCGRWTPRLDRKPIPDQTKRMTIFKSVIRTGILKRLNIKDTPNG